MAAEYLDPDPGVAWGFMEDGAFVPLPKPPLVKLEIGLPPFDVTLPTEKVRHIVRDPNAAMP